MFTFYEQDKKIFLVITMNDYYHENQALGFTDISNILHNPAVFKKPVVPTEEMNLGTIVHAKIFTPNSQVKYRLFAFKTGEQRTLAEKDAMEQGVLLITPQTQETATAAIAALQDFKNSLNTAGVSETPFYATQDITTFDGRTETIQIKAKPDFYDPETKTLYDLKITAKSICTPRERETFLVTGHYYMQLAHYKDVLEKNGYEVNRCVLVVVSYAHRGRFAANCGCYVGELELDDDYIEYGLQKRNEALEMFIDMKNKTTKQLATIKTVIKKPNYFYLKGNDCAEMTI
jgi:hypothetical protein